MRLDHLFAGLCWLCAAPALADVSLHAVYLRQETVPPPTLSNLDPVPEDLGLAGVELGLADNQTTGRFLGHDYMLEIVSVAPEGDFLAGAREALGKSDFVIADAPADALLALADLPEAEGALLFNATAEDMALRDSDCRANLLHTAPSYAMRTDALAQFLVSRRWTKTAIVKGTQPSDEAYAAALEASMVKFGLKPGPVKTWAFDADMRRNASQEVPLFTQDFGDYDVLLVADEIGDFGRYILYNTWEPRPVAGSAGLRAEMRLQVVLHLLRPRRQLQVGLHVGDHLGGLRCHQVDGAVGVEQAFDQAQPVLDTGCAGQCDRDRFVGVAVHPRQFKHVRAVQAARVLSPALRFPSSRPCP